MSRVALVVPTLGASPHLTSALAACRRELGDDDQLVVVWQGQTPAPEAVRSAADRLLTPGQNLGFAGGVNTALAAASSELVALVNDDVVVAPGWLAALTETLAAHPDVGSVQGINLRLDASGLVDGAGIGWNRCWQAVQLDREGPPLPTTVAPLERFGVSATAALYRRSALDRAAWRPGEVFDPRLFAWYEDVDLACRLRGKGERALLVPAARAGHAGSTTGAQMPFARRRWLTGNRLLVLARLFGRAFWPRLPLAWGRDLADAVRAPREAAAIVAGWARFAALAPQFVRHGPPLVPLPALRRFRVVSG